jgi:hypothetical protein
MTLRLASDGDREAVFAPGVAEEAAWFGLAHRTRSEPP